MSQRVQHRVPQAVRLRAEGVCTNRSTIRSSGKSGKAIPRTRMNLTVSPVCRVVRAGAAGEIRFRVLSGVGWPTWTGSSLGPRCYTQQTALLVRVGRGLRCFGSDGVQDGEPKLRFNSLEDDRRFRARILYRGCDVVRSNSLTFLRKPVEHGFEARIYAAITAFAAAHLKAQHKISYADAFAVVTAIQIGAVGHGRSGDSGTGNARCAETALGRPVTLTAR